MENKDFQLYEILYQSLASQSLSQDKLKSLLEKASKRNHENHVSGCLLYHQRTFFQVIEGEKEFVKNLFNKISKDQRHSQVDLIWEGEIEARGFGKWTMASLEIDHLAMKERFTNLLEFRETIENKHSYTTAKALLLNMRELLD